MRKSLLLKRSLPKLMEAAQQNAAARRTRRRRRKRKRKRKRKQTQHRTRPPQAISRPSVRSRSAVNRTSPKQGTGKVQISAQTRESQSSFGSWALGRVLVPV